MLSKFDSKVTIRLEVKIRFAHLVYTQVDEGEPKCWSDLHNGPTPRLTKSPVIRHCRIICMYKLNKHEKQFKHINQPPR